MAEARTPTEDQLGAALRRRRPEPRSGFAAGLRQRLGELDARARRPRHLWLLVAAWVCSGVVLLVIAASAGAAVCVPPGVSGVTQYFESVPGSSCNHPPPGSGVGHNGATGGSLPPGTGRQLARQGAAGRAVAQLVAQTGTAPGHRGGRSRTGRGGPGTPSGAVPQASGRNPVSALVHRIVGGGNGGSGILLPAFLAAAVVAMLALALLRRRRPHSQ